MKILLAIILIFPIFNIVAQNPVQPKDSTVGKDELIIISPEKKVHSDTSELMIIRDSSQKHKEANISELFIIGRNAYKRGHICKNCISGRIPKVDAVRDLLSRINPDEIRSIHEEMIDIIKRNRVFREGTIGG